MARTSIRIVFFVALASVVSLLRAADVPDPKAPVAQKINKPAQSGDRPLPGSRVEVPIDDIRLDRAMNKVLQDMVEKGTVFEKSDLEKVLNRREPLNLEPIPVQTTPLDGPELYRRAVKSTLALYSLSAADAKARHGARLGAAFFVHPSGIVATCYHSIRFAEPFAVTAATADGAVLKVSHILAIYPKQDLAFLKIEVNGVECLPLRSDAPAGTRLHALGHPSAWHFYMIEGILARYGLRRDAEKTGAAMPARMNLSIDSGPGFSGGPVLDTAGNVVGMIDSMSESGGKSPYKVHSAIPARQILGRFSEEYHETLNEAEMRRVFSAPETRPATQAP